MELSELIRIALRHYRFLLVISLIAGLAGVWFAYTRPPQYEGSVSFTINRVNKRETADYQYDGYYGIKAAELFGQTLVSWLETPSVLVDVYQRAGIEPHISSLSSFTGRFRAKIYSPQTVVVTFRENSQTTTQALAESIGETIVEKSDESNKLSTGESLFSVVAEPSIVVEKEMDPALAGVASVVAGFLIGIVALAFKGYIKEHASRR